MFPFYAADRLDLILLTSVLPTIDLGGGGWSPLFPLVIQIHFLETLGLYFNNLKKKNANLQKLKYLKKCGGKKIKISKNVINYTFLKSPRFSKFKSAKSLQKSTQNFFAKVVQSAFFFICFPKSYKMLKFKD